MEKAEAYVAEERGKKFNVAFKRVSITIVYSEFGDGGGMVTDNGREVNKGCAVQVRSSAMELESGHLEQNSGGIVIPGKFGLRKMYIC